MKKSRAIILVLAIVLVLVVVISSFIHNNGFLAESPLIPKPSVSPNQYLIGTDFGGDIALVGNMRDSLYRAHSNIVIDASGKELFCLPDGMVTAMALGKELSPSNNYIFATKLNNLQIASEQDLSCKYVLNRQRDIILSPEKNGYDKIVSNIKNFDRLADDGYLIAYKEESSYNGTEKYYWIIDFNGRQITEKISTSNKSVYVISDDTTNWTYIGDGIIDVGWFLDIKNHGMLTRDCPRDVEYINTIYSRAEDENGKQLFKLEAHARIWDFYEDKAGVIYDLNQLYNKDEIYIGLIDKSGKHILEPFRIDYSPSNIFLSDKGFLVCGDEYRFYDYNGNLTYTAVKIVTPNGNRTVYGYDSGFFRICDKQIVGNNDVYNYVNYLKEDGTWLFN